MGQAVVGGTDNDYNVEELPLEKGHLIKVPNGHFVIGSCFFS